MTCAQQHQCHTASQLECVPLSVPVGFSQPIESVGLSVLANTLLLGDFEAGVLNIFLIIAYLMCSVLHVMSIKKVLNVSGGIVLQNGLSYLWLFTDVYWWWEMVVKGRTLF